MFFRVRYLEEVFNPFMRVNKSKESNKLGIPGGKSPTDGSSFSIRQCGNRQRGRIRNKLEWPISN
jgi:hypothetical protein